jgi:hypothetical protein
MQVGDLSVVPEPSSLLLSICSVLPLVLRRRRPIG